MKTHRIAAALLACAAACAQAAPFATWNNGTVANSSIPGVANGSTYSVTLVFDNGGNTVLNQSWSAGDLTCVIYRMAGGTIVYAQDLVANPPDAVGSATTDATGYLNAMFTYLNRAPAPASLQYSATSPIAGHAGWTANGANPVFGYWAAPSPELSFDDAAGGVQMAASQWGPPQAFTGTCAAPATPPAPPTSNATPVPTLGHAALALLAGLLGAVGVIRRRNPSIRG